jgi:polyhydroxyalkanoate synthase
VEQKVTQNHKKPTDDISPWTQFRPWDQWTRAWTATAWGGASPLAAYLAWSDWALSFSAAPAAQAAAAFDALNDASKLARTVVTGAPAIAPEPTDRRFCDPAWSQLPFSLYAQAFLMAEHWVDKIIQATPGVDAHHRALTAFLARQFMDMASPANAPALNPEVIARTIATRGANLADGMARFTADLARWGDRRIGLRDSGLQIGRDLAATPGAVIARTDLMELIQYRPRTATAHATPVLIAPAWIMKYYILDLSAHNSLIGWLVDQGFTVFCISWRNPDASFAETGFDAYRTQGLLAALDAVTTITSAQSAHIVGYCLGGTLAAIAAAAMARDGDARLASLTLLAAQIDFTEAGELSLFIDDQQLATLDTVMAMNGVLDGAQMADAFALLGARDLIWSKAVRAYLLGEAPKTTDLIAWNSDTTRMPARMHSEYLHGLFQHNAFANGHWRVDGQPVQPADIQAPVFAVGTQTDHVAPWRSVFKIHRLKDAEIAFVLTAGGHNAGIISEPGHRNRHFQIGVRAAGAPAVEPDAWLAAAAQVEGSWWPAWADWLARHSAPPKSPPPLGAAHYPPLEPAPGAYVLEP